MISRVSTLFRGHPDLIVGFNTFLPPGYKIEVSNNETINVHQPGQQMLSFSTAPPDVSPPQIRSFPRVRPLKITGPSWHVLCLVGVFATFQRLCLQPPAPPQHASHPVPPANAPTPSLFPPRHGSQPSPQQPPPFGAPPAGQQPGQPVEFNHAISYVNKIKVIRNFIFPMSESL